jgi:hypothetical protein
VASQILIEIEDVSAPEHDGRELMGARIRPLLDDDGGSLTIQGWALGRRSRLAAVEVVVAEEIVGQTDMIFERPDIAERFPDVPSAGACGFRLTLKPEGAGQSELVARAILEDGTTVPIQSVRVSVSPHGVQS